jgi:hypothetical protein
MNFELWNKRRQPTDEEIERDVAELRQLLKGVDGHSEPHPAYYQNFLVKVRGRIDEERFQRRRVAPATLWASLSAAAVVVVLVVGGVFAPSTPELAEGPMVSQKPAADTRSSTSDDDPLFAAPSESSELIALGTPEYSNGATSLVLSNDDVKMLNAIMSDDDDALFQAMVESEGI